MNIAAKNIVFTRSESTSLGCVHSTLPHLRTDSGNGCEGLINPSALSRIRVLHLGPFAEYWFTVIFSRTSKTFWWKVSISCSDPVCQHTKDWSPDPSSVLLLKALAQSAHTTSFSLVLTRTLFFVINTVSVSFSSLWQNAWPNKLKRGNTYLVSQFQIYSWAEILWRYSCQKSDGVGGTWIGLHPGYTLKISYGCWQLTAPLAPPFPCLYKKTYIIGFHREWLS